MKNTKISSLIWIFSIGATLGIFGPSIYENLTSRLIFIYLNTALAIFILNMTILFWGVNFRNRLKNRFKYQPVNAMTAARTTALALAASRTGALLSGFYIGVALFFIPALSNSANNQRLTNTLITTVLTLWLLALGLWLERICQVPQAPNEDDFDK